MFSDRFIANAFGIFFSNTPSLHGSLYPSWEKLSQNWVLTIPITYQMSVSDKSSSSSSGQIIVECKNDVISIKNEALTGSKATVSNWKCDGYYHTSTGKVMLSTPSIKIDTYAENFKFNLCFKGYVSHSETGRYNNSGNDGYSSFTAIVSYVDGQFIITPTSGNACSWGTGTTSDPGWITSTFVLNEISLN